MKHVHFMGIGGSGASAVAAIAESQGYIISGCDLHPYNEYTKNFPQNLLKEGHSPNHLQEVDILAISPAVSSLDSNNPELTEAKKRGLELLTWQEFMGKYLEKDKFVIAICGTHGKTTATAMAGLLVEEAGLDPTVEIGSVIPQWNKNFRVGQSKFFITEADEYNNNFLVSHPDITIVTSIEMDHPEFFKDFKEYKQSFVKFLSQTKQTIIANLSNPGVTETLPSHLKCGKVIVDYSKQLIDFPLQIPGQHNILNASAVYQLGLILGIKPEIIQKSLSSYQGTGRRFEYLGKYQSAEIYSDYAHHPTALKVTLEAAREKFPHKKIFVVFQPHMFSRTKALFADFVKVLKEVEVDKIYLLDIFPSREVDTGLVHSQDLVEAINLESVTFSSSKEKLLQDLKQSVKGDQVIIFMGAGDIHEMAKQMISLPN